MKANEIKGLALALLIVMAACNESAPTEPDVSARLDQAPVCVEDGRGGHTMGGGNYAPGPCP